MYSNTSNSTATFRFLECVEFGSDVEIRINAGSDTSGYGQCTAQKREDRKFDRRQVLNLKKRKVGRELQY